MPGFIVDQWQKMLFCVVALSGQQLMCEVFSILTKEVLSSATYQTCSRDRSVTLAKRCMHQKMIFMFQSDKRKTQFTSTTDTQVFFPLLCFTLITVKKGTRSGHLLIFRQAKTQLKWEVSSTKSQILYSAAWILPFLTSYQEKIPLWQRQDVFIEYTSIHTVQRQG